MGYLKPVATALCSGYVKYRQCRIPKLTLTKTAPPKKMRTPMNFFHF